MSTPTAQADELIEAMTQLRIAEESIPVLQTTRDAKLVALAGQLDVPQDQVLAAAEDILSTGAAAVPVSLGTTWSSTR